MALRLSLTVRTAMQNLLFCGETLIFKESVERPALFLCGFVEAAG